MDPKDTTIVSFRASPEELQTLDAGAASASLNRAEYVRSRVFAADNGDRIARLEQQLHLLADHLGQATAAQENRKCTDPNHAKIYGVGHCFHCDLPIASRH